MDDCQQLARAYVEKAQHFFEYWEDSGYDAAFRYSEDMLSGHVWTDIDFIQWALRQLENDTKAYDRYRDLNALLPTNPP